MGWLATALAWWRQRPARSGVAEATPATATENELRQRLRQACQSGDTAAARSTLLAWAQAHWRDNPPRHLGQLTVRGGPDLAAEIEALNRASYGTAAAAWNGEGLWTALNRLPSDRRPAKPDGLEPLYRSS